MIVSLNVFYLNNESIDYCIQMMVCKCFLSLQYLTLPAVIAPYKCSVLPLSANPEFESFVSELCK